MKILQKMKEDFMIIEMDETYRLPVVRDVEEEWAGPLVVTRGQVYDYLALSWTDRGGRGRADRLSALST